MARIPLLHGIRGSRRNRLESAAVMHRFARLVVATVLVLVAAALPAAAGTVSIAWDPVPDEDLAGYRVYYGAASGSYSQSVDVGNVTSTTVDLADCQNWYLAVKAYDSSGNESLEYSNEVSGWARPRVTAVNPSAAEAGRTLDLTVDGANFQAGALAEFSNAGITVNGVTILSCNQLRVSVSIAATAAAGAGNVDVVNPDTVFGTGLGAFTVQAAVAPQVSATNPSDGATNVAPTVQPAATFSEAMLPASVTASTVRLLDASGAAVAQAAGSPSLSSGGTIATIIPAAALADGQTYRIEVLGGASGVMDLANNAMASTFRHGTGFTVTPDQGAPSITDLASGNVTATTAQITWTTDEPADGRVYYRRSGETAWQQTDPDTVLVTSHAADLAGLTPSATYEYYVRSADALGNSTDSSTQTFGTSSNTFTYIRIEAESGPITSPVRSVTGVVAFRSGYVDTPAGTPTGSPTAPAGRVTHGFLIPTSGTWKVWLRMYGSSPSSDAWFESVDGAARQTVFPSANGRWMWVAARSYTLASGLHSLELGGQEEEARVDRILITDDPTFVPTEQPVGDLTAPGPVASFTGTAGNQSSDLEWTNPSSDTAKTVIRYRTDGVFPSSPADGFVATERPAVPGSTETFNHGGLTNGVTYSYSAFAVDPAGNASPASSVSVTPQGPNKPGKVNNNRRTDKKPR